MTETRSQALSKKAVAREVNDEVEGRFLALEKVFAMQSKKTDYSIQEMVDAFKLMMCFPAQIGASTCGNQAHQGQSPSILTTHDIQYDHQHNTQDGDNIYTSMT